MITFISPDVRQAYGPDSALLVRGVDRHGDYEPERRPAGDFADEAITVHARAMTLRRQVFARAAAAGATTGDR